MEPALVGLALDSSVVIEAERQRQLVADFLDEIRQRYGNVAVSLSPVSVGELAHGVYRARSQSQADRRREFIEELVELVEVHPITTRTGWIAGRIEGEQAAVGNVIPFSDLLIGTSAIEMDFSVLTKNPRHFRKIPGLRVLSWGDR